VKVIYVLNTLLVDDLGNYIVDDLGNYIEMGGWTGEIEVSTYTLFDLTYRLARELEILEESTATANGSSTTVVDTYRDEDDDYFNDGTLWLVRDNGGTGALPEGSYSIVQDYTQSTGTITLRSDLPAATGLGDKYAVASKRIPHHVLVQGINNALFDLGKVPYTDTTSLTSASNQTEYTLPLAAKEDLREVWQQVITTDANDNRWMSLPNWYIQQANTGTQAVLVIPYQPLAPSYDFKLVYMGAHPEMTEYDDELSEFVPLERVLYPAVISCLRYYKNRVRGRDATLIDERIAAYEQKMEMAKIRHPIPVPSKQGKITFVPEGVSIDTSDAINKVYLV